MTQFSYKIFAGYICPKAKRTFQKARSIISSLMWALLITGLFSNFAYSDQSLRMQDPASPLSENKLLVLGDSLSAAYGLTAEQGWVYLLAQQWQQSNTPIEVVNAAISGDTTDGGLSRLPRLLALHQPTHLYIELGGNNALQGHNPRKIKQNLISMIELAQKNNVAVILQEMQIPTNYGARYTQAFTAIFHDLAKQYNVPLIPFFLQDIALDPALMQRDGIHPTADAQPLITEFMAPKLAEAVGV